MRSWRTAAWVGLAWGLWGYTASRAAGAEPAPADYVQHVAPIFKKYCAGCHNAQDREGKLSLESFADLQGGGEHGPAVLPGQSASSRLIRLIAGEGDPRMPPEGEPAPSPAEIALLRSWIDAGAKGPEGREPDRRVLLTPRIEPAAGPVALTAVAFSPDGKQRAVARFREVDLCDAASGQVLHTLRDLPGKVASVHFSSDGQWLVTASGVTGLYGQAAIWNAATGERLREFIAHRDLLYDAELSPDKARLATCSYDRKIILWNTETGEQVRTLEGHNDAVYDVAFSPDGATLASASGDQTIKLWQVGTGVRLDTLSQPQAEQYCVTFSPDGRYVLAGGGDNRVRVWRFVSRERPRINPLLYARFGHEGGITGLAFGSQGQLLISVAEDRSLRLWETRNFTPLQVYDRQPDDVTGLAVRPDTNELTVTRLDGSLGRYPLVAPPVAAAAAVAPPQAPATDLAPAAPLQELAEAEPNDEPAQAMAVALPARIRGVIGNPGVNTDTDIFRFEAKQGSEWVLEVNAARSKSPLDSKLEVLDAQGQPVLHQLLQAVRDSYFTFRGKDSDTSDDFRVWNWEEMELNEYLYADGEVVKLWLYPRGPDSGFKVYPGEGKRVTWFNTTPVAHALQAPCYVVQPLPPGTTPLPNGLPVFPVYYENDDDSERLWGSDSRLAFTAPADGTYLVRLRDARRFAGDDYTYDLTVRPRQPDFRVRLQGANFTVNRGSGKEFVLVAERLDQFTGEIRIQVENLPPGFRVSEPLTIEAGQRTALGTLYADADAPTPAPENAGSSKLIATGEINGQTVTHEVGTLGEIKLADAPQVVVTLQASEDHPDAVLPAEAGSPLQLVIAPGETITALVKVERRGFDGRIQFGNADCGRNLPHGVYVDNIGLNGLLIPEGQTERKFFITAAKTATETVRPFHLKADADGGQTSPPILLHVRPKG